VKSERAIELTAEEVVIRDSLGNKCRVEWSAVTRIEASKVDLLTTDEVRIEFVIGDRSCVASEDDAGWEQLMSRLRTRFPVSESWRGNVLRPPFATNRAVLWDRRVHEAQARWQRCNLEALWQLSRGDLAWDGALRDMYVHDVGVAEWNDMIAVARGASLDLSVTSLDQQVPHELTQNHFAGDSRATILFRVGSVSISGHCFDSSQIELSFAPDEITSSIDLGHVLEFAVKVTAILQRPAFVTPENLPEAPIFKIDPTGDVQFLAPGAG
jgi:hypothetical protein